MVTVADDIPKPPREAPADDPLISLVELMYFAYRDFTAEADQTLAAYSLGRAHHRVLHFVRRNPGLRVTDLLDILRITKQSLGRVLTPLIDDGWIDARADSGDRRAKKLYPTERGTALADRLARQQIARIAGAMGETLSAPGARGEAREDHVRRFLYAMISPEDREDIRRLLAPPVTPHRSQPHSKS